MTLTRPILSSCSCPNRLCRIPFGLCHCGCGAQTSIAKVTSYKRGQVVGYPVRFVRGHASVEERFSTAGIAAFRLHGVYCRLIPLTKGMFAIINAENYEEYCQWHWFAKHYPKSNRFYAARHVSSKAGRVVYMHRQILGLELGDPRNADHVEPLATTDNTVQNLRIANNNENRMNQCLRADNAAGYKGVCFRANRGHWIAQIAVYGKHHYLGSFKTPEAAHEAYKKAATQLHGEFARFA